MATFNPVLTKIDCEEAQRYAGLAKKKDFKPDMLADACLEAHLLARPKACWEVYRYDCIAGCLPDTGFCFKGRSVVKHLAKSKYAAIMGVTIGNEVEQAITDLFRSGNYTMALLLDAAATTAVEMAADAVSEIIARQAAQQGFKTTFRFSPGYGDWDITVQHEILTLAKASSIHLSTTDSCMLTPRKSVTAVIGLVPNNDFPSINSLGKCRSCPHSTCFARKESQNDKNF